MECSICKVEKEGLSSEFQKRFFVTEGGKGLCMFCYHWLLLNTKEFQKFKKDLRESLRESDSPFPYDPN